MMPSAEPGAPLDAALGGGGLSDAPPPPEPPDGDELGVSGIAGPAIGRDKKESAVPRGKPLQAIRRKVAEEVDVPRSHESTNFAPNLANLSMFHGGAGRLAQSIANMIRTDELSEVQRKGLANVLSHLAAFAPEPAHWSGVDADKKLEMALQSAGIWKIDSPALQKIVPQMKRLTHLLAAKHDGMLESNIRMLRKASDPDALILKTFRISLAENRDGQMAAIRTARTFAIDIEDVVAVVKEAAARRPFREASEFTQQVPNTNGGAAPDLTQDIPMFPVEQGAAVQAGGAIPGVPNASSVPPTAMQPANQSNSTNKPLSPADMRLRQAQQQQQQTATPTAQQAQAPVQAPVAPAAQQAQAPLAATPPAQAQQPNTQALRPAPRQAAPVAQSQQGQPFKAPGQVMNKNDPALRRGAVQR
jgi:hypothetical protein